MTRAEQAVAKKKSGMNCAQAVACSFCDVTGIDEQTTLHMMQPLGIGIGATMEGTCGALTGASVVLGLADKDQDKIVNMKRAGELIRKFEQKNGAVTCKLLKGVDTKVVLRPCNGCVEDAAAILEELIS